MIKRQRECHTSQFPFTEGKNKKRSAEQKKNKTSPGVLISSCTSLISPVCCLNRDERENEGAQEEVTVV